MLLLEDDAWQQFVPAITPIDQAVVAETPDEPFTCLREAIAVDEPAWQAVVAASDSGDFLHDWGWAAVAAHDREPQRRFVLEEDGQVAGVVAAQTQSMLGGLSSWYVPHGPVLDYRHPHAVRRLGTIIAGLSDAAREAGAIAVRLEPRVERDSPEAALLDDLGLHAIQGTRQVSQTQIIDLDAEEDAILAAAEGPTRRKIRRAERDGVTIDVVRDPADTGAVERLAQLVRETEQRSGARGRGIERIGLAWHKLASRGRAAIVEAWFHGRVMASGMVVLEGDRSFYLFSGSRRDAAGEPKHFPSYAMLWGMTRLARSLGSRAHDLWGIEPPGTGPEHPWHGIGTFKRSFGGRSVVWAGSWDLVLRPNLYRLYRSWSRTSRTGTRLAGMVGGRLHDRG